MGGDPRLRSPRTMENGESVIERDRLVVETVGRTDGPLGVTETWTDGRIVWARVLPISAMARATHKQLASEVTHEIRIKGRLAAPFGQFRFRWLSARGGPVRLIPSGPPIRPDGSDRYTVIMCRNEIPTEG